MLVSKMPVLKSTAALAAVLVVGSTQQVFAVSGDAHVFADFFSPPLNRINRAGHTFRELFSAQKATV